MCGFIDVFRLIINVFQSSCFDRWVGTGCRESPLPVIITSLTRGWNKMAETKSHQSCCVPFCYNSKKKQPYLSFHSFPCDKLLRSTWVSAIRRDEFAVRKGSTFVCALHFNEDEILAHPESDRKHLKPQAVPSRFLWNNWGTQSGPTQRAISGYNFEREMGSKSINVDPAALLKEHDYDGCPPPGKCKLACC